jgi:hypothetical protein
MSLTPPCGRTPFGAVREWRNYYTAIIGLRRADAGVLECIGIERLPLEMSYPEGRSNLTVPRSTINLPTAIRRASRQEQLEILDRLNRKFES